MHSLHCKDKVPPREVKPCLLVLETEKFSVIGQPNVKLVFSELVRGVKTSLALPSSLYTFYNKVPPSQARVFPRSMILISPDLDARCMV